MVDPLDAQNSGPQSSGLPSPGIPPKKPLTVHLTKPSTKKETSRIELSDAEAPTEAPGETLTVRDALNGSVGSSASAKSSTSRIHLYNAEESMPGDRIPEAKDSTTRIVLGGGATAPRTAASQKESTVRMDLTGLVEKGGMPADPSKTGTASQTARVDLTGLVDKSNLYEDKLKTGTGTQTGSQTGRMDVPGMPVAVPPKTIRLQRPSTSPKTVILRRPGESAPAPVSIQRENVETAAEDSAKGATARISIPESVMPSQATAQRKTIMIKRQGQTTLSLARPVAAPIAQEPELEQLLDQLKDEEPGAVYSVLALVATLLLAVLLYVLVAQTLAPTLPFPGRII
jgi:hypothetical protein